MDKYIIEFCEILELDIELLDYKEISKLENTFAFKRFKLAKLIREVFAELRDETIRVLKIKR